MDTDAIIAEAFPDAPEQEAASVEAVVTPEEDISKKPDEALTPDQLEKRDKNRRSHQNSKEASMRRELKELRELVKAIPQTSEPAGKPALDNFDTLEGYNEALIDWKTDQKFKTLNTQTQQTQAKAERASEIANQEAEFAKSTPEYAELVNENQGFFKGLTRELANGLSGTENPHLALFALMKEGRVDDLHDLTPTKLAAELARAEIRGQGYIAKPKIATSAPSPVSAAKGNAIGVKSINSMNFQELKKELGLK